MDLTLGNGPGTMPSLHKTESARNVAQAIARGKERKGGREKVLKALLATPEGGRHRHDANHPAEELMPVPGLLALNRNLKEFEK
jgi:hypothetical protein